MSQPTEPVKSRILLLDDDEGILALARKSLERAGYEVVAKADAAEAERALLQAAHGFDLLVLDYQIGGPKSGLQFFLELSEKTTLPPAVLVTGFSDEARLLEALRAGMRDVIRKSPDFLEALPLSVGRVLRELQSEQRAAEAEDAMIAAQAASRAKDHFLAILSHELRTPLTPVLAALHELDQMPACTPEVKELVHLMRRNIELEARLIDDLLDLTRISRGKITLQTQPVNLHEELRHVTTICHADAQAKEIDLRLSLDATQTWVTGDAARLQQVFWNLVKNAIKFTPKGGSVSVITADAGPGRLRVVVRDTGIGIAPDLLPRVFDAFEQGGQEMTHQFGGLGLGLAISRALVTAHQGTIQAASEGAGKGATFTVELAASADSGVEKSGAKPVAPATQAESSRQLSILLVEDHADTARMLARLLTLWGHKVSTAEGVEKAKRMFADQRFDLLISDIGLPDGSGLELMRSLRAQHPVGGIVLSGYAMQSDIDRSREAGFNEHLPKPVDLRELEATIDRLRRSLLVASPR